MSLPFRLLSTLLISILACLHFCFAQNVSQLIENIRLQNAMTGNRAQLLKPEKTVFQHRAMQSPIIPYVLRSQLEMHTTESGDCIDSSFKKLFEAQDRSYNFLCSAKTKDGCILLGGFGRSKVEGPPYRWYSVITKFDSVGNHLWSREIRSDVQTTLYIESMTELMDGSILVSGWHENVLSTSPPTAGVDFFAAKITSDGNLLWLNTYHSLLGNGCTTSNIRFVSVAEDGNGDLYLGGTVPNCPYPTYLVVFKIGSSGTLMWNYSFSTPEYENYCMGIFFEGDHVTVINRGSASAEGIIHVDLLKLNSFSGSYISHKGWKVDLPYPDNFWAGFESWTPQAIRLNNGNYCVYGPLFGDFAAATLNADEPHFAVLEFNNNYDFVKGYNIHSSLPSNASQSRIKVDRFGRAIYIMSTWVDYLNQTKHLGSADNGTILNQRTNSYLNFEGFYDNLELFDDGSFVYINTIATPGQDNFYLDYLRLHNSDTGSNCLGLRDNFSHIKSISYVPFDFSWVSINANIIIPTPNQNNSAVPIVYTASPPCSEKTWCDTLHINGGATSCDLQNTFTFTCYKNKQCGSAVRWMIDPSVVQLFQSVNDTTIKVQFNKEWQGWLRAEIPTSCGRLSDSLFITVASSPGKLNLGADTALCAGNTILLNARRGYASYKWNDGTTDSVLTVRSPGKYFVDVQDACNNFFTDTVVVATAPAVPIDLGPDRTKCNNDTLHLTAPPGFINYSWGPDYSINTQTGQQVVVQPAIDTIYFVKAEKTAGCFAFDTIRIKVNRSPEIDLGADKSFCAGDSLVIDAGTGFAQYEWNTGPPGQKLTIYSSGSYSVIATTVQGCKSYDTMQVINTWPNPLVTLDDNPSLCSGSTRILRPGNFVSYVWQDGSTNSAFVVTAPGTYYVTVTDNNQCKTSDTVNITQWLPLPANFLPADTSLCNYGSLLIKCSGSYSNYKWSNNSVSSSITVNLPGMYWLQVTDDNNCTGRDSIVVNPKECLEGFYIPTAFTPNQDGKNDVFRPIIGGKVKQYQFTIYNRWGQVVFTTNNLYKGWDGNMGGIKQDTYVFVWTCSYQLEAMPLKNEKGTVVLIR